MLAAWFMCGLASFMMTSCSDQTDNPVVNPDNPADTGGIYDNMDLTVRPGDDFFMHSIGKWWDAVTVENGLYHGYFKTEIPAYYNTLLQDIMTEDKNLQLINAHFEDIFSNTEEDMDIIDEALERVQAAETTEDLWKLMGTLMKEGLQMPFAIQPMAKDGFLRLTFTPSSGPEIIISIKKIEMEKLQQGGYNQAPRIADAIQSITGRNKTRGVVADKWPMLVTLCEALDINPNEAFVVTEDFKHLIEDEDMSSYLMLEDLQAMDKETLAETIQQYIKANMLIISPTFMEETQEEIGVIITREHLENYLEDYLRYYLSYVFVQKYVTPEMKAEGLEYVKELKDAFRERIAANTWLSEGSKVAAREKLDAMVENVGYPDQWLEEGIIDLSQSESLFEDMMILHQSVWAMFKKLSGQSIYEGSFNSMVVDNAALTDVNAFYDSNFNSMNILPVWLMKPLLDPQVSEGEKYAAFTVWGHEITHGFDTRGALFDKKGDFNKIWTTVTDEAEFQRRALLFADYHNGIEIFDGQFADGYNTLIEDIADLGGVEIAFQALTNKLKAEGFSGENLRKEQRNFFIAFANLYRAKYYTDYAYYTIFNDNHSLEKQRINGIVPHIDAWYDLFDVKPGDALYLAPEKRIHIW